MKHIGSWLLVGLFVATVVVGFMLFNVIMIVGGGLAALACLPDRSK